MKTVSEDTIPNIKASNPEKNIHNNIPKSLADIVWKDWPLELLWGKKWYSSQLNQKINSWEFKKEVVNELKDLGFREKEIVENYIELKKLIELYNNRMNIEIISFENLKNIVKSSKNLGEIKNKLKNSIDLKNYSIWVQALIISILS